MEIVKLIGADVLPDSQKATLEIAKVIRTGFLQQNAFHKDDTFVPIEKQNKMMDMILYLDERMRDAVGRGIVVSQILKNGIFDEITRMKYNIPNDDMSGFISLKQSIDDAFDRMIEEEKR